MRRLLTFLAFAAALPAQEPSWGSGGRIVLMGDSITDARKYVHYLIAYLQLRNPSLDLHTYSIGLGGTNVANWVTSVDHTDDGYQYYDKYMGSLQPGFAIAKFGYNGSYTADEWQTDLEQLIVNIEADTAVPILLGPQPQSDTDGSSTLSGFSARMVTVATAGMYDYSDNWNSLDQIYTANLVFTAATNDECTSAGHGMTDGARVLVNVATAPGGLPDGIYYVRDAATDTFKLSTTEGGSAVDITSTGSGTHRISQNWAALQYPGTQGTPHIHHGTAGHAMDAYTCIANLGWGTDVSAATIDGDAGTLTSDTDCTISNLSLNAYDGVDFDRLDDRLPWAIDEDGGRTREEAIRMIPAMNGWQSYTLTVTDLPSGTYDVYVEGDVVASVTHTELAAGWNMSELTTGAIWEKGQEVLGCIRDLQGCDRVTLVNSGPPNVGMVRWKSNANVQYVTNGLRDGDLVTAMASHQTHLDGLMAAIHAAAAPETFSFSLRRQGAGGGSPAAVRTSSKRRAGQFTGGTAP